MTRGYPNIAASIVQQNGMTTGDTPLVATADDAIGRGGAGTAGSVNREVHGYHPVDVAFLPIDH